MDILIIAILVLIGVILFILEVFFLPGITIAGIGGILFFAGALYHSYNALGTTAAGITLISIIICCAAVFFYFLKAKTWNKIALNTDIDSKVENKVLNVKVGDTGKTTSRLAPIGQALINGKIIEAKAEDELIDEEEDIIVTEVHTYNVTVKKLT